MMDPEFEATEPFLPTHRDKFETHFTAKDTSNRKQFSQWHLLLIIVSLTLSHISIYLLTHWTWTRSLDTSCALHTSQSWSPVMNDIDIAYSTVMFNGTFFKNTIYRQPPSPEVDQAWRDLGIDYNGILVPPSQATKSNIDPNRVVLNETWGGPGYPAIFEVFHQLHCLDILRKSSRFNYDYYRELGEGSFGNSQRELQAHIGHCIETIRQQLMCTADTGVHPFILVGDPPMVFPDFNREHKCKNFDDIREWAKEHQGNFNEKARFHTPLEGELILDEIP